jgi:UDP-N-acetylglucosamine 3-dehydrogenase
MLRVGIAGFGGMGSTHARAYAGLPEVQVVAAADLRPERREAFVAEYGGTAYGHFQEMIEAADLDIVGVCLPTDLHSEAAVAAARAGQHVLTEKPMARSVEQCDAMIGAAKEAGTRLMVAQVLRFWPEYALIKEIADSGRLGKVLSATAIRVGGRPRPPSWFAEPARSGGAVLDLHIHDIDFLCALLGRPKVVSAAGAKAPSGALDICFTTLTGFPGGAVAFAQTAWATGDMPFEYGLRVDLEGGTLALTPGKGTDVVLAPAEGAVEHPQAAQPEASMGESTIKNINDLGGYFLEVQYFVQCVLRGERPERVAPESSRQSVEVCLAAKQSVETGKPVRLRKVATSPRRH